MRRASIACVGATFALLPAAATNRPSSPVCCPCRAVTSDGISWISKLRYGFPDAPFFGTTKAQSELAKQHATLEQGLLQHRMAEQQQLYCKALVYASSGSRLARDWIAGCAALQLNDSDLVLTALQHDADKADIHKFVEHLARRRATIDSTASAASHPSVQVLAAETADPAIAATSTSATSSTQEAAAAAASLAADAGDDACASMETIQRCFIYDAMKAATFHEPSLAVERLAHIQSIALLFGVGADFVAAVKDVVDEEQRIMMEKFKVLDQPTADQ